MFHPMNGSFYAYIDQKCNVKLEKPLPLIPHSTHYQTRFLLYSYKKERKNKRKKSKPM